MAGSDTPNPAAHPAAVRRWVLIPAALALNVSVGESYAFGVFNEPLTRLVGISAPSPADWKLTTIGWVFTMTYACLGLSAGLLGAWQDRVGPRTSGIWAAGLWASGFLVSALGVKLHAIALLYLGYGVLGGSGCGLGFTTPIAPLLRWFPDRPGLATGFAVMGFGGGAIVAAPLSQHLMVRFATPGTTGVAAAFVVLGAVYFLVMLAGALAMKLPPEGWAPNDWPAGSERRANRTADVPAPIAVRTHQFYLLWWLTALNVAAGLGALALAAPMVQEVFTGFSAAGASAFVTALGVFNMGGRLAWAWLSDHVTRRLTYAAFFSVGPLLYLVIGFAARSGNLPLFVAAFAAIITVFGGGFALLPAYVADVFGTRHINAIHGRLLTALSVAGVAGPLLVNFVRDEQIAHGVTAGRADGVTLALVALLLIAAYFCNRSIRPLALATSGSGPAGRMGIA